MKAVDELENIVLWDHLESKSHERANHVIFPDRTYELLNYAAWVVEWRRCGEEKPPVLLCREIEGDWKIQKIFIGCQWVVGHARWGRNLGGDSRALRGWKRVESGRKARKEKVNSQRKALGKLLCAHMWEWLEFVGLIYYLYLKLKNLKFLKFPPKLYLSKAKHQNFHSILHSQNLKSSYVSQFIYLLQWCVIRDRVSRFVYSLSTRVLSLPIFQVHNSLSRFCFWLRLFSEKQLILSKNYEYKFMIGKSFPEQGFLSKFFRSLLFCKKYLLFFIQFKLIQNFYDLDIEQFCSIV